MLYSHGVMLTLETTQSVPLKQWEDGSIRITGSRVPIETILYHYNLGSTPEQIARTFQGIRAADIYAVIAYYLNNCYQIDQYLREREGSEEAYWRKLESDPEYQRERREFRERLMVRWAARQQALENPVK